MPKSEPDAGTEDEAVAIREAADADAPAVIALIEACFRQYDGCVMDLPGLDADLPEVASHFAAAGGRFWVAEDHGGAILGCVGYTPASPGVIELKRLYVAPTARRRGLATRLYRLVRDAARERGAMAIELWSDTRFAEAHDFYLAHGFGQTGATRRLDDPSDTTEYQFRLDLRPR